jgi:ribonuclease J
MSADRITFIPLGGVDNIGANCFLIETPHTRLLLDAGLKFPYDDKFGIRYLSPQYAQYPRPDALLITHGHEDHIGSLSRVTATFPGLPIYAPEFAKKIIKSRYPEAGLKISPIAHHKIQKFDGGLELIPILVEHSTPDTFAFLFLFHPQKLAVLYCSDFKISGDESAPREILNARSLFPADYRSVLMADSTNISSSSNRSGSESSLPQTFQYLFSKKRESRIFVTTFPSNVERLATLLREAKRAKRAIYLMGRSMEFYSKLGQDQGLLEFCPEALENSKKLPKGAIGLVSGCQGDMRSRFSNLLNSNDDFTNDLFVFSSKTIPGNENAVNNLVNLAYQKGAEVFSEDLPVHVSGHACREDLAELYRAYRPDLFVPIHGESHHLHRHSEYFRSLSPDKDSLIIRKHQALHMNSKGQSISKLQDHGLEFVQGENSIPMDPKVMGRRRALAKGGAVFVSFDPKTSLCQVSTQGVGFESTTKEQLKQIVFSIVSKNLNGDHSSLIKEIKRELGQYLIEKFGQKAVLIVHSPSGDD